MKIARVIRVIVSAVLCLVGLTVPASADDKRSPIELIWMSRFRPMPNDTGIPKRMFRVIIENDISNNEVELVCDGQLVSTSSRRKIKRTDHEGIFEVRFDFNLPWAPPSYSGDDGDLDIANSLYACQAFLLRGDSLFLSSNTVLVPGSTR